MLAWNMKDTLEQGGGEVHRHLLTQPASLNVALGFWELLCGTEQGPLGFPRRGPAYPSDGAMLALQLPAANASSLGPQVQMILVL